MPIPDPTLRECLEGVTVNSFTASPTTITPGNASTLRWNVNLPGGLCRVVLYLNGSVVSNTGTRSVEPINTTAYSLDARVSSGLSRPLRTITVNVDTSDCDIISVPESDVRENLRSLIKDELKDTSISERSPANVEIDRNGIAVRLRLKISVPSFWDPDLNVNMVIALSIVDHKSRVSFRSYSNDLDWPPWAGIISLGTIEWVDNEIERLLERAVKPLILQKIKEQIDSVLEMIPSTHRLYSLTTESNEIRAMICPA